MFHQCSRQGIIQDYILAPSNCAYNAYVAIYVAIDIRMYRIIITYAYS